MLALLIRREENKAREAKKASGRAVQASCRAESTPEGPWPSPAPGPPFREPDPYPAGVPAPVDPGKGCGWPSPAPGPQGPVDPEFSSVSDSGGSVVGREMGWIPGQRGLCNIPFFFRKNENIGDVNVH